jgi:hypothetical protein
MNTRPATCVDLELIYGVSGLYGIDRGCPRPTPASPASSLSCTCPPRRWSASPARPPPPPLRRQQQKRTTGRSWHRCCLSASPSSSPRFAQSYTPSKNSRTPDLLVPFLFHWPHMIWLIWLYVVSVRLSARFRWRQQYKWQYPDEILGKADAR